MLSDSCTCLEAVASPSKLFFTQRTRVDFQRLFMMVACVAFAAEMVSWTSVRIWCPGILKINSIYFVLKAEVMPG